MNVYKKILTSLILTCATALYAEEKQTLVDAVGFDGSVENVQILIDNGADVNAIEPNYGRSVLHLASLTANRAHVDIVKLLIDAGADVNVRPLKCKEQCYTILQDVCDKSKENTENFIEACGQPEVYTDIAKVLIHAPNIDLNARYNGEIILTSKMDSEVLQVKDWTALHFAALRQNDALVAELIRAGADITRDSEGRTAFDIYKLYAK